MTAYVGTPDFFKFWKKEVMKQNETKYKLNKKLIPEKDINYVIELLKDIPYKKQCLKQWITNPKYEVIIVKGKRKLRPKL